MKVLEIPTTPEVFHYIQRTEIDGKTYTFEFEWIERGQFCLLHVGDQDGHPIASGVKLVPNWAVLKLDAENEIQLVTDENAKLFAVCGPNVL